MSFIQVVLLLNHKEQLKTNFELMIDREKANQLQSLLKCTNITYTVNQPLRSTIDSPPSPQKIGQNLPMYYGFSH